MSTASQASNTNSRLHREDWIHHALERLRKEGVTGLRVEPLAKSLGVTTGSFYWHFRDRQDLLDSVLEHWTELMTSQVARRMTSSDDPEEQLRNLLTEITQEERSRYEIAIRNWATFEPSARASVRRVDECRMAYVNGLFLQLGFSSEEAQVRTRMLIFYQLGEAGFSIRDSLERRLQLAEQRLRILTADC